MRRDELYVADLVDNTRAIREYLDGIISREQWDQDRVRRDGTQSSTGCSCWERPPARFRISCGNGTRTWPGEPWK